MKFLCKILPAALLFVCSCSRMDSPLSTADIRSGGSVSHDMIVLGSRLEDPYTVENMSKALFSLYPTKAGRGNLETTDLYVRFLPSGQEDCDLLESLGVEIIDHPLDYEIVREGDYYHDSTIPDDQMTWQYAVVKPDFKFPQGIPHEIIDECYLVENASPATKASLGDVDWAEVERESYRLTGNERLLSDGVKGSYAPTAPKGRITIVDEIKGEQGVAGVRVQCNSFIKFANCFTDDDGNYQMSRTYTTDVRYRLVFKNKKGFCLGLNLLFVPASMSTLGKSGPEGIDARITSASDRRLFCRSVVNNVAYEYYNRCKENGYSIKTPPANLRIWLFQLMSSSSAPMLQQGAVVDNSILSDFLGEYLILVKLFLPDITLGMKGCDNYDIIYNSTIHELAHASHFMQAGIPYWDKYCRYILTSFITSGFTTYGLGTERDHGYCEVGEMWAYYLSSRFNRDRYSTLANFGSTYWFSPQILMYLDERGIDRFKIFKALTPDVTDKDLLQEKLIELYPGSRSLINQAFDRYE
ncbi:MAG: hypothetical protein IJU69_06170 [Bacteroidales bacterium]|nr:hypothetical protein [Bacteroidales bacterium]